MQGPFSVHKLSPLAFKRFSATVHFFVMPQMILTFINLFQILNINLLMYLNNYDIIGDLMNINEVDQTYFVIPRPNTDNLMWVLLFSFL